MSRSIPTARVPVIAAWLAARGRDPMNAPESMVALALEAPYWPGEEGPGSDEPHRFDEITWPAGDPPPWAR